MNNLISKNTKQRKAISDLLLSITKFSSAQEVHNLLISRGEKIGLATVYRTLQALSETGLLMCYEMKMEKPYIRLVARIIIII